MRFFDYAQNDKGDKKSSKIQARQEERGFPDGSLPKRKRPRENASSRKYCKIYPENEDYFHALEEAYKVVRKKLKQLTHQEKASSAFSEDNYPKIFGHIPQDEVERDFFEGTKFLNMAIQKFRNEKAHDLAKPLDRNVAIHYLAVASLAYDLITRNEKR